ncbi:uncharacterized protein BDCG_09430 [Blastomyces dermatitidis ER-3]|uniref:Uncharacterized protein n=2 Tax=Ajellomyces dermatitidis TaxID=5039 RepID=F2TNH3_AJEDA|nr:uncharacterized protein BDCG_09430 [Blastomyces dermatitidis ER-3]EEQ86161.1 hypothetical protein BDCG_09430 [Blastomyces dermatitidis ER-3]EGE84786.2 hypothetical protein BDDG_07731 [Blastomyces dermatitidis ATCC 18188]
MCLAYVGKRPWQCKELHTCLEQVCAEENSTRAHQAEPFATRNGPSQAGSFGAANTIEKSQVHSLQEKWKLQAACFGITVTLRLDMYAGRIEYAPSLFPTKP